MSDELDGLERDIRATRARLAANISVLTSSATLDDLTSTVKSEALGMSDDLMDRARTSGMEMLRRGIDDLKDKAMENPVAVAAIGAGIGWKLWKNPPIASALVGYGLFSLLRGSAEDPVQNAVRDAGERLGETASAVRRTAMRTTHDLRDKAVSIADQAQSKASSLLGDVQDKAAAITGGVRDKTAAMAGEASSALSSMSDETTEFGREMWATSQRAGHDLLDEVAERARALRTDPQSQILLSIAGVAVAAAVGVAVSRYRDAQQD
jgi:cell division septum initiation protein DivIVA